MLDVRMDPAAITAPSPAATVSDNIASGAISVWDLRMPQTSINTVTFHKGQVTCVEWHPNQEQVFVSGGDDGVVYIWDNADGLVHQLTATKAGVVQSMDALLIGRTAVALGAGRDKKSDAVDPSAGIILHKKPGEAVAVGEPLLDLHYNDASRLSAALALATQATGSVILGATGTGTGARFCCVGFGTSIFLGGAGLGLPPPPPPGPGMFAR